MARRSFASALLLLASQCSLAAVRPETRFAKSAREARARIDALVGHSYGRTPCPCSTAELCKPIVGPPAREREVFGFHSGDMAAYNWSHITTVAWVDSLEQMCDAHAHNVRVIMAAPTVVLTGNRSARAAWVANTLELVQVHSPKSARGVQSAFRAGTRAFEQARFADGVTFDF